MENAIDDQAAMQYIIERSICCRACGNKMPGIYNAEVRSICTSCGGYAIPSASAMPIKSRCETPQEILDRLRITNRGDGDDAA